MEASKRQSRTGCGAGLVFFVIAVSACGSSRFPTIDGNSQGGTSAADSSAGGKSTTGGSSAEGSSTGGSVAGGSSAAGGNATGGNSTGGSSGSTAADASAMDSDTAGDNSTDGGSIDSAAGCIDVCGLYGPSCCFGSGTCVQPGQSCFFEVLSAGIGVTYEYAALEQKLASLPQDVLISFADTDITWAAADPSPAARIEMHMSPQASLLYGSALESPYPDHPFRVSCGGQSLFVGVTYFIGGAAAIKTPVLHVARDAQNLVVLRIGAWQGAWIGTGSTKDPAAVEAEKRIDRSELRAAFCQRGALKALPIDASPLGP